jgi:hypothetical protein
MIRAMRSISPLERQAQVLEAFTEAAAEVQPAGAADSPCR